MSFTLIHFHILSPITVAHFTCVFLLLVDDTHIDSLTLDVLIDFFVITRRVWCIKTFSVTDKACYLVSTRVKLIYVISSMFSYTKIWFRILGALVGSLPFVESFILEALWTSA